MNKVKKIILSSDELSFLRQFHTSLSLQFKIMPNRSNFFISLTKEESEILSDELSDQLARIGFNDDYSLTSQGEIIECLIDKLFIP